MTEPCIGRAWSAKTARSRYPRSPRSPRFTARWAPPRKTHCGTGAGVVRNGASHAPGGQMADSFDELSRAMASPRSRRGVMKMMMTAAAGATAAAVLRPFRAEAVCPAGAPVCGSGCCQARESCSDPSTVCCCPSGTTPCGKSCCRNGVACVDRARGICGCPPGTTPCGNATNLNCCAAGKACGDSSCQPVSAFASSVLAKTCGATCENTVFTDDFNSDPAPAFCRQALTNWNIGNGGNVDVVSGWPGASGNALDLDGSQDQCPSSTGVPPISLKTPITTQAGKTYTAKLRISTNPSPFLPGGGCCRGSGNPDINTVNVTFGPVTTSFTKQPGDGFTTETVSFVAAANGTAQLTLQEAGVWDRGGIILDTVTVTESC
jgi:hypothetical protein